MAETAVRVSWKKMNFYPLDGYVVWYQEDQSETLNVTVSGAENVTVRLTALQKLRNYSIEVAGFNAWEVGPRSGAVYVVTEPPGEWGSFLEGGTLSRNGKIRGNL